MTGLLTRFVPEKLKHSSIYRLFLRFTRVLQFLSSIISLGIFSSRMYKVYRLVNTIKTRHGVSKSYGAVEGILAAAVLYTLLATLMSFILKGRGAKWLRWLWVLLDLAFVGAFTAVAILTRPSGGSAGPRHCYNSQDGNRTTTGNGRTSARDDSCNLPWGTFILAIISTILHAITAAFHEVRDHHRRSKASNGYGGDMEGKGSMDPHGSYSEGRPSTVNGHGNPAPNGGGGRYSNAHSGPRRSDVPELNEHAGRATDGNGHPHEHQHQHQHQHQHEHQHGTYLPERDYRLGHSTGLHDDGGAAHPAEGEMEATGQMSRYYSRQPSEQSSLREMPVPR